MKLVILDRAEDDLVDGFDFYELREAGLGQYFLCSLSSDIESLGLYGGCPSKSASPSSSGIVEEVSIRDLRCLGERGHQHSCRG
jgi:hypothetical protein